MAEPKVLEFIRKSATVVVEKLPTDVAQLGRLKDALRDGGFIYATEGESASATEGFAALRAKVLAIENGLYGTDFYSRPEPLSVTKTTVTIPAGLQVMIDETMYQADRNWTLPIDLIKEPGSDVYIYACKPVSGLHPDFVLSRNNTAPSGYQADTSRKIGGFHCLCADVGTIGGHRLTGLSAGDILPDSLWDLKHRPVSDPEGMVYIKPLNKWVDIYLASWNGSKLVSQFGGVIADGGSAKKFHGELFQELFPITANKDLISRAEFQVAAYNSPVHSEISTSADPDTTGGHRAKNTRRIISDYGVEDCVGVQWQWTRDLIEGGNYGTLASGATADTQTFLNGYEWKGISLYQSAVDGSSDMGFCHGWLRRLIVGGSWLNAEAAYLGSRSIDCRDFSSAVLTNVCGRGVANPK